VVITVLATGCQGSTSENTTGTSDTQLAELITDENNPYEVEIWDDNESTEAVPVELNLNKDGIIEIEEDKYVTQVKEIYNFPDKYKSKTINYQGYVYVEKYGEKTYYSVVRNTYACDCGGEEESVIGFEVQWDGEMPEVGTWVDVTGIIDSYMEEENEYGIVQK